jgi:hypothetical protein
MAITHVPCPKCGGRGGDEVTREMAMDGGDRSMQGMFLPCRAGCDRGFIEVDDAATSPAGKSRHRGKSHYADERDIPF